MNTTTRSLVFVLSALLLMIVIIPFFIGGMMGYGMSGMMGYGMSGMSGMMNPGMMGASQVSGWTWGFVLVLSSLRSLSIVGALIVGAMIVARSLADRPLHRAETALEIVQRRYAAGEITASEYQQMRQEFAR